MWRVDPRPARVAAPRAAALQAAREAVASVSRPRVCVVFSTLKPAFLRFLLARSLRLAKPTWRRGGRSPTTQQAKGTVLNQGVAAGTKLEPGSWTSGSARKAAARSLRMRYIRMLAWTDFQTPPAQWRPRRRPCRRPPVLVNQRGSHAGVAHATHQLADTRAPGRRDVVSSVPQVVEIRSATSRRARSAPGRRRHANGLDNRCRSAVLLQGRS